MKKIRLVIIFLVLLLYPTEIFGLHVVGIGDSITSGYGVKEQENYLSIFCKQLEKDRKENVGCINQAIDGITTEQLLLHLKDETFQTEIKTADYLMMSIGGNDLLQELTSHLSNYLVMKDHYSELELVTNKINDNMKLIYEQLSLLNPNMKMLIVPLYNPYDTYFKDNKVLIKEFDKAKKSYVSISNNQKNITIMPKLSDVLENRKYTNVESSDRSLDPHPNKLGHQKIAEIMIEQVRVEPVMKEQTRLEESAPYLYVAVSVLALIIAILWYHDKK